MHDLILDDQYVCAYVVWMLQNVEVQSFSVHNSTRGLLKQNVTSIALTHHISTNDYLNYKQILRE